MNSQKALVALIVILSLGTIQCVPVDQKSAKSTFMSMLYDDYAKQSQYQNGQIMLKENVRQQLEDPTYFDYLTKFLERFNKMFELLQAIQNSGQDTQSVQEALTAHFGSPGFINYLTNILQQFTASQNQNIHQATTNEITTSSTSHHQTHQNIHTNTVNNNHNILITSTKGRDRQLVDAKGNIIGTLTHEDDDFSDVEQEVDNYERSSTTPSPNNNNALRQLGNGTSLVESAVEQEKSVEGNEEELQQIQNAHYKFSSYVDDNARGETMVRKEVRDGPNVSGMYAYDDGVNYREVYYRADNFGFHILKQTKEPSKKQGQKRDGSVNVRTYNDGTSLQYHMVSPNNQENNKTARLL